MMLVQGLRVYPIKGCRGVTVTQLQIGPMGPALDRQWMLVEPNGRRVSQRRFPQLTQVDVRIEDPRRIVIHRAGSRGKVRIHTSARGPSCEARMPGASVDAEDLGDDVANWFSDIVGRPVRLVRKGKRARYSPGGEVHGGLTELRFADAYPLLITALESLAWLNTFLVMPAFMDQFRPNIILTGGMPFDEDRLKRFQIGGVRLVGGGLCHRCGVVNVDQLTGQKNPEVLKLLCQVRMIEGKPRFGLNVDHLSTGTIDVGQEVQT